MVTMVEQFQSFSKLRHCVWLDTASGEGHSLLAAEPAKIFRAKGERRVFERLGAELESWPGYAIGYFGYDLKNEIERLPSRAMDDVGLPDCWFGFYKNVHRFEVGRGGPPRRTVSSPILARWASAPDQRQQFIDAVRCAKQYIAAGDIYQVNLSQRFQCDVDASPADVYLALRAANPAPYCAYLDIGRISTLPPSVGLPEVIPVTIGLGFDQCPQVS